VSENTYSKVGEGKHLFDMFPIKNGLKQVDALKPLPVNFDLEYAIKRVQVNQDGLKLKGTHQLLFYADDVNIMGRSVRAIKNNTEALLVSSKEIGLEVNVDKTKYMVLSRDRNAGKSHNIKIANSSVERVGEYRHLGTTFTNINYIQEEIKSRMKSWNALLSYGAESFVVHSAFQK